MTALPPDIDTDDEVSVTWEQDDLGTKIVASLGGTSITIESAYGEETTTPWLIAALPNILDAAWAAIESDTQESP